MLEKTSSHGQTSFAAESPEDDAPRIETRAGLVRRAWHFFVRQSLSSLTRRIIFLNLTGLFALMIGILYLSQFRAGLIDARIQSLLVQGEIIAAAIAATPPLSIPTAARSIPNGCSTCSPARPTIRRTSRSSTSRSIRNALRGCCSRSCRRPTRARASTTATATCSSTAARIYDVIRFDLPPPDEEQPNYFQRRFMAFKRWLAKGDLPTYRETRATARTTRRSRRR